MKTKQPKPLPDQAYLSATQAAKYLGFTSRTLRRKAIEGEIPAVRIFGSWRFHVRTIKTLAGEHPSKP